MLRSYKLKTVLVLVLCVCLSIWAVLQLQDGSRQDLPEQRRKKEQLVVKGEEDRLVDAFQDAELIPDPYQRCLDIPMPRNVGWNERVIAAFCADGTTPTISWHEITSSINTDTGRLLDDKFDQLVNAYYAGNLSEGALNYAYENNFENATIKKHWLVDRWLKASPKSAHALTAKGMLLMSDAWQERGESFARLTPKERLDKMRSLALESKKTLQAAIAIDARIPSAYATLMEVARIFGDDKLAKQTLDALRKVDPANYYGVYAYAAAMEPRWAGDSVSYELIADEAAGMQQINPRFSVLVAQIKAYDTLNIHYRDTRYEEIAKKLEPIVRSAPHYWAMQRYAYALYQTKRYLEAYEYYSQLVRFAPADAEMYLMRGKSALAMNRRATAMKDYSRVRLLNPNHAGLVQDQIHLLMLNGEHREALAKTEKQLTVDPENAWLLEQAAWIAVFRTLDEKKARYFIDRGLAAYPAMGVFHWLNWEIIRRTGAPRVKEATEDFIQRADKNDPRQVEALKYTQEYL